jgi:hypothetical protein
MRTKLLSKALLMVGLAIVVCGFSIPASATTFTFTESAGFVVGTSTSLLSNDPTTPKDDIKWYQDASAPVLPLSGEYNTIAWGVSNNAGGLLTSNPWGNSNYSALQVFGQTGPVVADGGWVTLTKLYHQNSAINSVYWTLKNAIINGSLNITPSDAGYFPNTDDNLVTFTETLNAGTCDPTGPAGPKCPDYFTINAGTFAPLTFTYGGHTYDVDFRLVDIVTAQIDPINPAGDIKIWTQEGSTSQINVEMKIETETVPEPATLTLLGLGLLGLGFIKRRRKND